MRYKFIFISFIFISSIYAECYELNEADCLYWNQYCEWNDETGVCQEIGGGGGGGGDSDGPYTYATITEAQGLRNGPDYLDGVLYYPIDATPPFASIVLSPGFGGDGASMSSWGSFFASHGYIAMTIGPNDPINDSHDQRGEGLIDGIETIRQENYRQGSPVNGLIDEENFIVSGYSMGGGASHNAALMDGSIKALISLNPTVLFEDCNYCEGSYYEGELFCICLVPELIEHYVPSLIFAGQVEVNELEAYAGLLGQDVYNNLPSETEKIIFEVAGEGHGAAAYPYGEVSEYILSWLDFKVNNDEESCNALLETPTITSLYETNITCSTSANGDVNGDSLVNVQDIILTVNFILTNGYNDSADLNGDGTVDILDVVQIVNIILQRT